MIESELPPPPPPELGPPVLLKRLGNVIEANLARAKLDSAGIPSFLGGPNVLGGDMLRASPQQTVELFVPQSLLDDALDVLDAPPDDAEEVFNTDVFHDDAGRRLAFRALVCAVVGWTIVFLTVVGLALGLVAFVYAIYLAVHALLQSREQDQGFRLQIVAAVGVAVLGIATCALLALGVAGAF